MDVLLTHGYYLHEDPHEQAVMKPYPPLGLLYISAHLKARGFSVGLFDTTFAAPADLEAYVRRERPPVVGLYTLTSTSAATWTSSSSAKER
jgi:anaerobic magnesium-protoporphyrin IX monomethyl ester cyclase